MWGYPINLKGELKRELRAMLDICEIEERELGRIVNYRVKVSRDETSRETSSISSLCTHFRDF